MKNNLLYRIILFVSISIALSACEKDLEVYNAGDGLNFFYENSSDSLINYSFVYGPSTAIQDTVWLKVETIGPLSSKNRHIDFEQVHTGTNDAVAGTHYIAFDEASLKNYFIVPSDKSIASVPVVLKREASLKTKSITLLIRIKTNDYFKLINPERNSIKIVFTDQLHKPSCWAYHCTLHFGVYGPVKHKWLIDQTGNKWDDDYLSNILGYTSSPTSNLGFNSKYDEAYSTFLSAKLTQKLNVYNADRIALGLNILKEADGTIVSFNNL